MHCSAGMAGDAWQQHMQQMVVMQPGLLRSQAAQLQLQEVPASKCTMPRFLRRCGTGEQVALLSCSDQHCWQRFSVQCMSLL